MPIPTEYYIVASIAFALASIVLPSPLAEFALILGLALAGVGVLGA